MEPDFVGGGDSTHHIHDVPNGETICVHDYRSGRSVRAVHLDLEMAERSREMNEPTRSLSASWTLSPVSRCVLRP